jgi:hypothetical protein
MVKDLPVPLVGLWMDLRAQLDIWERKKMFLLWRRQRSKQSVNVRDVDDEEEEHRNKQNDSAAILASLQGNIYIPIESTFRIVSHS